MIEVIGWTASLVAALTALAMLHDAPLRPLDRSTRGWARHVARLVVLVGIAATGAVLCAVPSVHRPTIYDAGLRLCLACMLAMQSPCPWWRYVFKGAGDRSQRGRAA